MSATELRIALLQLVGCGYDRAASLARGEAACRAAAAAGADLALFPELWSTGYAFVDGDLERWRAQAIAARRPVGPRPLPISPRSSAWRSPSTYLERSPAGPRNVVTLFDAPGARSLTYAKVHTCSFDLPEQALARGTEFPVARLETRAGQVAVGAMICFDREFPEAARVLALGGAELLLVPNACELEANRLGQVRARAFENMAAVAVANYAAPQENGHSTVVDPIAFDAEGRSRDTRVFEAGEAEDVCVVRLDLDALREWRRREVWGDQCRRPETYGALVEEARAGSRPAPRKTTPDDEERGGRLRPAAAPHRRQSAPAGAAHQCGVRLRRPPR